MTQPSEQITVRNAQLDLLRDGLAHGAYPRYPSERLVANPYLLARTALGRLILPDGPWTINMHPNRRDSETVPSPQQQAKLQFEGLELDSVGRPIHPWISDLLSDASLGVVTGKGAYWQWGPNRTVDPIIVQNEYVLLVERGDTGNLALPGGFIDKYETTDQAGRREVAEETSLQIGRAIVPRLIHDGPVADIRITANAWPATTALLYHLPTRPVLPEVHGADDALTAAWVPLDTIEQTSNRLFGSHYFLLQQALAELG